MTPKQFEAVWDLLIKAYPRFYPGNANEVWIARMRNFDATLLLKAVGNIIDEAPRAPAIAQVIAEYYRVREENHRLTGAPRRIEDGVPDQRRWAYIAANNAVLKHEYHLPPEDRNDDAAWDQWLEPFKDAKPDKLGRIRVPE